MTWRDLKEQVFGNPKAVAAYRDALADLDAYTEHQREQNPHQFEAGVGTAEYAKLDQRVTDTEQDVPWWRR